MKIRHASDKTHEFAERIVKRYLEGVRNRLGFHRSDAISCPLKAYWRLTGHEPEYSPQQIGNFILGNLAHAMIESYFDTQELQIKVGGLVYVTIDATLDGYPIEIKTTRRKIYRRDQIPQEWIEQLAFAMSALKKNKGYLFVLNYISFAVMVWEVEMTDNEIRHYSQQLLWSIIKIIDAVKKRNPEMLHPKHADCQYCMYRKICPYKAVTRKKKKKR